MAKLATSRIKGQFNKSEGGKTFKRIDNTVPLYYIVYDAGLNMVTESEESNPMPAGNVIDTTHTAFASTTFDGMVAEAQRLGIKR